MSTKKIKQAPAKKTTVRLKLWHYLLLAIIPAIVYGRVVMFDYVMHDDDKMILENRMLKEGFNPQVAFTTDAWFMNARIELYRPWQSITYMVDYAIGGTDPMVYHIHNLVVFILGACLLFYFLQYYFRPLLAWAGTLVYSMNLLTPHAVAWITARGDLYLMVFGLLCLIMLQKYLRSGSKLFLWLSVPVFFLALLSKESAIALLPVGFIMMYADKKRLPGTMGWVWLGVNAALFIVYFLMRKPAIAVAGNLSATAFVYNLRSLAEEFLKMIIPVGFSVMPGYSLFWTIGGFIALGALAYFVWKHKPEPKVLWTGAAIWLAFLLPSLAYESSFASEAYDYMDHRSWLPFTGIWIIILGVLDQLKFTSKKYAPVAFGSILLIWSAVNFWRVGIYENWDKYYLNAIRTNEGSGLANLNYGSLLKGRQDWAGALPYIEKGVKLSPYYMDGKIRLAEVYFNLKRYAEAIEVANEIIAKEPLNVSALQFRGSALGASGKTSEAAQDFKTILSTEPNNLHAIFNLGVAYKEANQLNEAIETFSLLITKKPDFPNAYFERGFSYGKMGLFPQAKTDMDESIRYQPEHGASYFFRGRAYEGVGVMEYACRDWQKALQLGITEAEAHLQQKCKKG